MDVKIIEGSLWTAKKIENTYVVSLKDQSNIIEVLTDFVINEKIRNMKIAGIGRVNEVSLRFFNPLTWKSFNEVFDEPMNISNISGDVSEMDGQSLLNLYVTLEKNSHIILAGHLADAEISGENEFFFYPANAENIGFVREEAELNIWSHN